MIGLLAAYFLVCPVLVQQGVSCGTSQPGLGWQGSEFVIFDLAVDYTPLRYPILKWSEQFGLRKQFEQYSYLRRSKRYFASLPKEQLKGLGCVYVQGPLPFDWPEERQAHFNAPHGQKEHPSTWEELHDKVNAGREPRPD